RSCGNLGQGSPGVKRRRWRRFLPRGNRARNGGPENAVRAAAIERERQVDRLDIDETTSDIFHRAGNGIGPLFLRDELVEAVEDLVEAAGMRLAVEDAPSPEIRAMRI